MASSGVLKRGFKAEAERKASTFRSELGFSSYSPLCAFSLSRHLGVSVYSVTEFFENGHLEFLRKSGERKSEWSALTMMTKRGNRIIIHNTFHTASRQQSDIMHELAHIICNHKRTIEHYDFEMPFGMHHYDELQEEEAKCLGSTLQLPKSCLLWARKQGLTVEAIATHFNASVDMVKYRLNITGVAKKK